MLKVQRSGEIALTRGDTARLTVTITDDLGEPYKIQIDDILTLSVKRSVSDADPLITKTIIGTDTFHIRPSDTTGLEFGKYLYDVQVSTYDGDVYTVIPPTTFEILTEVTI